MKQKNVQKIQINTLQDKDHRISYHHQQCDPDKMFRDTTLLPYNHQALNPPLPSLDHSFRTDKQLEAYTDACNQQKENRIKCLKNLRKK